MTMDRFGRRLQNTDSAVQGDEDYVVERIINKRKVEGETRYLVKWEGYDSRYNSWEPESCFNSREMILDFEENFRKKMSDLAKRKRPRRAQQFQQKREEMSTKCNRPNNVGRPRSISKTQAQALTIPKPSLEQQQQPEDSMDDPIDDHDDDENIDNVSTSSGEEIEHGFSRGLTPEAIVGAGKVNGQPSFLIKWKGNNGTEFIPTRIVYEYTPKLACAFYESKIVWVD